MTTYHYRLTKVVCIEASSDEEARAIADQIESEGQYNGQTMYDMFCAGLMDDCNVKNVTRCGGRDGTSDISVWKNPTYAQRLL